jgi:FMN phosphatase YigB (HAD superfamily)
MVEASLLQTMYGGRLSTWMAVHDRAFRWYLNYWTRHGPDSKASYREIWQRGEIEWMRRTLTWGGIDAPTSEIELFRLDRNLTYEITQRINVAYPYARKVLGSLRRRRFRLFLVSGADSTYIKGALEATRFNGYFERVFSPDKLDAFKGSLSYWKKILKLSRSKPESSAVVDDRAKFLRVPAKLGLRIILVDPDGPSNRRIISVRSVKEVLSLGVLPNLKKRGTHASLARIA